MKKRILCWVLSVLLAVTVLPARALAEDEPLKTSEAGIEMIKRFEGFSPRPMVDGSQWSIGYGNACDPADYPYGITEEEADQLLRESLAYFEDSVDRYIELYGVELNQAQYDAVVSVTYNLGVAWINSSYRFWSHLRSGVENFSDNQIASALGVWCHVGTAVSPSLLQRRIQESLLFLYGDYDGSAGESFCYLVFDPAGGEVDTDVMLYKTGGTYEEFPAAEREGYYFAGWYDAPEGGERILAWDTVARSGYAYARWSAKPVAEPVRPDSPDVPNPPVVPVDPDPPAARYPDVKETDWYYPYVDALTEAGVISGYTDGRYRAEEPVTTGQALKLILLAAGYPEQPPVSTHWASGYRSFALQRQFVFDGELGGLDEPITRGLMAKLAAQALGADLGGEASVFYDTDSAYVMALYRLGILEGSIDAATGNRMYYPDHTTTRGEIAKVVWTIYNR
ncbi:MAG: glycoside hydrolase family protein [Oscillospiraceae bacterium]|nr:glycoside hydrolase family protein [Oscillospiraceae bacterium]